MKTTRLSTVGAVRRTATRSYRSIHTSATRRNPSTAEATKSASTAKSTSKGPELINKTMNELFQEQINRYPHKDLLRITEDNWGMTFSEAKVKIDALAAGLLSRNLRPEGSLVMATPAWFETVVGQVASARAGMKFMAIEPGHRGAELESQLLAAQPQLVVWPPKYGRVKQKGAMYSVFPKIEGLPYTFPIIDKRFPYLQKIFHTDREHYPGMQPFAVLQTFHGEEHLKHRDRRANPNLPYTYFLVSTGKVDGVTVYERSGLSEYSIINVANVLGREWGVTEEDIVMSMVPLHTAAGQVFSLPFSLVHKSKYVLSQGVYSAQGAYRSLVEEKATFAAMTAPQWEELLALDVGTRGFKTDLKAAAVVFTDEHRPDPSLLENIYTTLNLKNPVLSIFSAIDVPAVAMSSNVDDLKSGGIGRVLPHMEAHSVRGGAISVKGIASPLDIPKSRISATDGFVTLSNLKGEVEKGGKIILK